MYAIYNFKKARLLAEVKMVNDASDPTVDETDVLTQRMQKMIKFREKMLTNASVNIKNAQTRYKKDLRARITKSLRHPYILFHFYEMIFTLVFISTYTPFYNTKTISHVQR